MPAPALNKARRARPHRDSDARQLIDATIASNPADLEFRHNAQSGHPRSGPVPRTGKFSPSKARRTSAGHIAAPCDEHRDCGIGRSRSDLDPMAKLARHRRGAVSPPVSARAASLPFGLALLWRNTTSEAYRSPLVKWIWNAGRSTKCNCVFRLWMRGATKMSPPDEFLRTLEGLFDDCG